MNISFSEVCDIGLKAAENQDAVLCAMREEAGLFAVADGMGGHDGGAFASKTVLESLGAWWKQYTDTTVLVDGYQSNIDGIGEAAGNANKIIRESVGRGTVCGSTLVALWLDGSQYAVISCGDSRCYRVTQKFLSTSIECLTKDDVWQNKPSNVAGLSSEQIRSHRNYGKLLRAVGTEQSFSYSVNGGDITRDTLFVLCSDGIYKYLDRSVFEKCLKNAFYGDDLNKSANELKQQVYKNGAPDNLSVVLVKVDVT